MWNEHIYHRLAAMLLCLVIPGTVVAGKAQSLQELLGERRCDNYVPATYGQLQQAEAAFVRLLQDPAAVDDSAATDWQTLGFRLRQFSSGNVDWLVLHQEPGECTGQGLYLVRLDATAELALQVPHGYFDRYTDDIAAGLLPAAVRIIALNTARRFYTRQGSKVDADLAHRSDNFFAALTHAFARVFPYGRLVQLHGFNPEKRQSEAGRSATAIISAGSGTLSAESMVVATCLHPLFDGLVRLYPRDVRELGGTGNLQGRMLRANGHDGFVHMELNRKTRERLRDDEKLRSDFAACLSSGMRMP
jgi:hypothetical protein